MSDVAVAPAPASAPAAAPPAPAASEVAINTNPTSAPNPVGPQAPDKPVGSDFKGSEHRPESRRETIQKAFERARAENPPKPREARMGDNNPPEAMEVEREKPKPKPAQPRAEHGHFASAQQDAQRRAEQQGAQQMARPVVQLPEQAPFREAPPRMAEHARNDWHATPESVRGEVHRMHHEFGRAHQQYRADYEVMNTLRPFQQLAQQHGTTLQAALTNYVLMEEKLRNDPIGGCDVIISNLNLVNRETGQKVTFRDLCWDYLNQTPEQQHLLQAQNHQMAQSHQLAKANQRIAQLENHARQMQYREAFLRTRGAIDQYADTHPRLDELGDIIEGEIKLGFDLDTAYRRAEMLRPATHAAQTRTSNGTHAAQTRTRDRSISGAPGPSNGAARPREKVGRREAIAGAMKRANGSL